MAQYARQHWIPRSYLRRWCFDQERLHVFDKLTRESRTANIRDVAQHKHFYEAWLRDEEVAKDPRIRPGMLEAEFERWEQALVDMTAVAERVARGGSASLEERRAMSIAVAVQVVRTPRYRADLLQPVVDELIRDATEFLREQRPDLVEQFRLNLTLSPAQESLLHALALWDSPLVPSLAAALFHYFWRIGVNQTESSFYTSDAPVVGYVHALGESAAEGTRPGASLVSLEDIMNLDGSGGFELAFPLSPRLILTMYHPKFFEAIAPVQGLPWPVTPAEVHRFNALQTVLSDRQLFSITNEFDVAIQTVGAGPDVAL